MFTKAPVDPCVPERRSIFENGWTDGWIDGWMDVHLATGKAALGTKAHHLHQSCL